MRKRRVSGPEIEVPGKVLLRRHEGAIVCSLEQPVSGNCSDWNQLVGDTISDLSRWILEQGGLVGHIKAALATPSGTFFYSCTGGEVQFQESPDPGALLAVTVIAFFVEEDELKRRMEEFLNSLM